MSTEITQSAFADLIRRVRIGDQRAAEELVQRYEPQIRREARMRLRDPRLRRIVDSIDICQSVLASFFTRAKAGAYEIDDPRRLIRLLAEMARNKVAGEAQRQNTQKRRSRGIISIAENRDSLALPSREPPMVREADLREFRQQIRDRLNDDERAVLDLRAEGHEWAEIAARLGGAPVARRMQLKRALDRIGASIDLDQWMR